MPPRREDLPFVLAKKTIAVNVRRAREAAGFTQLSLAEEIMRRFAHLGIRCGYHMIDKIERGEVNLTLNNLVAIAIVLGCPPQTLLLPPEDH